MGSLGSRLIICVATFIVIKGTFLATDSLKMVHSLCIEL